MVGKRVCKMPLGKRKLLSIKLNPTTIEAAHAVAKAFGVTFTELVEWGLTSVFMEILLCVKSKRKPIPSEQLKELVTVLRGE